ncbi:NAD(P)H-binding protein, partial [Mycolicibacter kumamotonensis]|uniref:NAD(P)H-binding protein n=1 Tax=Mycolicibacter kumamotonensis TaxID=354243 RepID=UPI0022A8F637
MTAVEHIHEGNPLRISIFGGTGPTGLLVVEQALANGHDVVAFARTPSKLPEHDG